MRAVCSGGQTGDWADWDGQKRRIRAASNRLTHWPPQKNIERDFGAGQSRPASFADHFEICQCFTAPTG